MRRGEVYRFRTPKGVGHEQQGVRYGVVVQADELLPRSVVIVAPTSRSARSASFRPEITVAGDTTRVLVEQLGAVDAPTTWRPSRIPLSRRAVVDRRRTPHRPWTHLASARLTRVLTLVSEGGLQPLTLRHTIVVDVPPTSVTLRSQQSASARSARHISSSSSIWSAPALCVRNDRRIG